MILTLNMLREGREPMVWFDGLCIVDPIDLEVLIGINHNCVYSIDTCDRKQLLD